MSSGQTPSRRPSVLLVEDHADSRAMYAEFLSVDFDVLEAGDGVAALEVLREARPDVIVTDLALPRMDGLALMDAIRTDERFRDVPVIALSGYSSGEHEVRARRAGAVSVLNKPCLPDALAAAIAAAASRRKDG